MAEQFPSMSEDIQGWLARQNIFFTATAAATGRVNVSPRSTAEFRVLGPNDVAYLDFLGSGSETSAHIGQLPRMTIMTCSFAGPPRILRLYGQPTRHAKGTESYENLLSAHFDGEAPRNARQIITLNIDLVQTSCGYGVPLFDYTGERPNLKNWAKAKSDEELQGYCQKKNKVSIDGFDTGWT